MQEDTHLARFGGGAATPLTLFAQQAGTATADAGPIHDTQAPVSFSALLMRGEFLVCRTPQRSVRLECKVLTRETVRFPGQANLGRSIAGRGRSFLRWSERWRWDGRGKLGDAYRVRVK